MNLDLVEMRVAADMFVGRDSRVGGDALAACIGLAEA
jgi:hypothetical protein